MHKVLKILLVTSGLTLFAGGLFSPIYAIFVENIGGDILTAGIAYSIFAIIAGVLTFIISRFEDKIKYRNAMIITGYALGCLGFLGYIFIKSPMHLFLVQIVFGLANAIKNPSWDATYSSHLDKKKSASEWGDWEGMALIVIGIASVIGSFIAQKLGFTILFIIMFSISLLGLISSLFLLKTCKKEIKNTKKIPPRHHLHNDSIRKSPKRI